MNEKTLIFKKVVDKSILHDGFTIPQYAHSTLKTLGLLPQRGDKNSINVTIEGQVYSAILTSVDFQGENASHSDVVQVRYTPKSQISTKLRALYQRSTDYIFTKRASLNYKSGTFVKMPKGEEQYLVFSANSNGTFEIEKQEASILNNSNAMIEKTITVTLTNGNEQKYSNEGKMVMRMNSSISPLTAVEMIRVIDNKINPREAKSGPITKAIFKTLEEEPELFWLKSKGVVLATTKCEIVPEPNKVVLSFEDPAYEGIMDGGHNFLAIANFITTKLLNEPLKTWKDCKAYWAENYDTIKAAVDAELANPDNILEFSIPIEIIAPTDEEGAIEDYYKIIGGVCKARNNNVQLQEAALSNQAGFYEYLKECLPDFDVQWKTNGEGTIKVNDVVSWATLPLFFLQQKAAIVKDPKINPINIYSSKTKSVTNFSQVLNTDGYSDEVNGKVVLTSDLIKSALLLVPDILKYFDRLTVAFPELFKKAAHSTLAKEAGEIVDKNKKMKTLFKTTEKEASCTFPYAYVYPLVVGVIKLMTINDGKVEWIVNPASDDMDITKLDLISYCFMMESAKCNPQKVGKEKLFYEQGAQAYTTILRGDSESLF